MRQMAVRTSEPEVLGPLDEPGFKFTPVGLEIQPWVKFEQWTRYGRKLQLADRGIQWAIGDWLIHGENHFPDKYDQAVEFTGYREGTLMNYATVAKAIPNSRRRESVDYSTHVEVASLKPEDQDVILAKAARENLSRNSVRRVAEKIKREGKQRPEDAAFVMSKSARAFLDDYMQEAGEWVEKIPLGLSGPERDAIEKMIYGHGNSALWLKNRTPKTDCAAIVQLFSFEEGTPGIERANKAEISAWLEQCHYFMSDSDLEDRLHWMVKDKRLEVKSVEDSRQDGRRGVMIDLYALHPDYEAQLDSAA